MVFHICSTAFTGEFNCQSAEPTAFFTTYNFIFHTCYMLDFAIGSLSRLTIPLTTTNH